MLPPEPKIFHGRDSELSNILQLFNQGTPRIAILGAGGMGKTSLARAVIHHTEIAERYNQHRFFIACDSAATPVELATLIGAHVGLKPEKDPTHAVIQYFSSCPNSVLVLDNLDTLWEPVEFRGKIEEFLSLLTSVDHLALVITMRGAERPAKVAWTHPFLSPLKPLEQAAARQTFIDIADNTHDPIEVDKVLSLTDNMPLAINLIAHLVDSQGCSHVLSHWEREKTSLISDGYDRTSNLDLSISLSLSSPRLNTHPHSKDLLSLLSMLPDGLSDVELVQSKLPIDNILGCKAVLIRTTLAYSDEHKRLKVLVPIREYMQKIQPPGDHLIRPLLKHFQELLEFYMEYQGSESSSRTVARVSSNYSNIQNVLQNGLQQGHPDLVDSIYCACYLNHFSCLMGHGPTFLIQQIHKILPHPCDHRLKAYLIIMTFSTDTWYSISIGSNSDALISEALENFKHFDDPNLKCRFYNSLANYYLMTGDPSSATKICGAAISLALSTGNTKQHSLGLWNLAWVEWNLGNYSTAQLYIITTQAEIHKLKSESLPEEGNSLAANTIFRRCLKLTLKYSQIQTHCLERLGDFICWDGLDEIFSWTTVFLVHSLQRKEKLGIYKALQFLGDVFLSQNNVHTATSLFTVALEGFTWMDVHCSRAECMLQLGDIFKAHGNLLKAVEFWDAARPLFKCSSQAKQVQHIDNRLANISKDVLEQHRNNLAHLAELNVLSETVKKLEDDLSDIED
ncbi:P-loop containing nucleoside triphosphate hydrolase protein [Mycena leptocephala]|nr:P-loop containing nucleoside triphosphate hydrolase protein [Mycena leptocephala]